MLNMWLASVFANCLAWGLLMLTYLPCMFDVIIPMNESRSRVSLIDVEYFVDQETYFFIISIHVFLSQYVGIFTITAVATILIAYVLHTCAMFEIAR